MKKFIITSTLFAFLIFTSSSRVLTKNSKNQMLNQSSQTSSQTSSHNSSQSSSHLNEHMDIQTRNDAIVNQMKEQIMTKIQKDIESHHSQESINEVHYKANVIVNPLLKNESELTTRQNELVIQSPTINAQLDLKSLQTHDVSVKNQKNMLQTAILSKLNEVKETNQSPKKMVEQRSNSSLTSQNHQELQSYRTPSEQTSSHNNLEEESNQTLKNQLMIMAKNKIAENFEAKPFVTVQPVILNEVTHEHRSNETSSLVTNSHATHSHATDESCNRLKKENASQSSNNTDVQEETIIKTNSQVLSENQSSAIDHISDSRVSSSNGIKLASAFIGVVTMIAMI